MPKLIRVSVMLMVALLLGACNFPLGVKPNSSSPAADTPNVISSPAPATETVLESTETITFTGSPPGEPPTSTASWLTDPMTPINAKNAYAIAGDDYLHNQFERPFDKDLAYRPDLDILSATLTFNNLWYYITIQLEGVQNGQQTPAASYGVELDVNLDGRGDFVVWTTPPFTTDWSRQNIAVYKSSKDTVGGPHPLVSDAPWKGDTYDTLLFDGQKPSNDNAGWVRVSPKDPKTLQIAFSPDIVQKPVRFLWGAWADDGIKDPSKFDYNDLFTKKEAGSPYKWDPEYPPKSITSVDNTCRAPYGFKPNGNLPGKCELQPTPGPTIKGATPTKTLIPPPP